MPDLHPDPVLSVVVHDVGREPHLMGLCAGYELGEWRAASLASNLIEWLPEVALSQAERDSLGSHNVIKLVSKAAQIIYTTEKYQKRGEPGEILLHAVLRQEFGTLPAIQKFYFKDGGNDTVKGFDAVHVVATATTLELWLGEVKFYSDIDRAIRDVVTELHAHSERDYLRKEFLAISNKLNSDWPFYERLEKLLKPSTSLDEVFDNLVIPVLLTYDSEVVAKYSKTSDGYRDAFRAEIEANWEKFSNKTLPDIRIELILVPLHEKERLMREFDARLKALQSL